VYALIELMPKLFNQKGIVSPSIIFVLLAALGLIAFILFTQSASFKTEPAVSLYPKKQSEAAQTQTGNGAPSGSHYQLNLIGVPKGKTAEMTGDNGRRIFVNLFGNTKVFLSQSTDGSFGVLDANGTDGNGATFKLPAPGDYTVWARALGKPGGSSTLTSCAIDPVSGETVCSTDMLVSVRTSGGSKFTNVTKELTTITIDPTLASTLGLTCSGTVNIFDACLQDYFWSYDNNGLKLLQLRFYQR
jgi:hypothetical protein